MRKFLSAAALCIIVLTMGSVKAMCNEEFRAMWVSTVINLDWPSKPGLSVSEMKAEAGKLLDRAAEIGLNAVMFQVRPTGDALYKSDIFPWSEFLTGTQGQAPADGFDPLAYWIEEAHRRGLELHAWINPYRVTHSTKKITDINKLAANNPARLNPGTAVAYDNALYYDPGLPANRQLITEGIREIINKYDVDGIHLDDYFYPHSNGVAFEDAAVFAAHGMQAMDKNEWRRENVNTLIKGIQQVIRENKPSVRFGVSPFAIWMNKSSHELGSDSSGFESYSSIYSDSRRWVKEGWVDYVCPQIYWYIGQSNADYSKVLTWWLDVCKDTGVDLYIGTAAYREDANEANWGGEIMRQLQLGQYYDGIAGYIYFRAKSLMGHVGNQLQAFHSGLVAPEVYSPLVMSALTVVQPSKNETVTDAKGYYFFGACDPSTPLYVNGWPVTNVTPEGFWSVYCPLWHGEQVFTFTQYGQEAITRTINNREPAPVVSRPPAEPVKITEFAEDYPYYATVNDLPIWAYPGHTTEGGSNWMLLPGQKDRITGVTEDGAWLRLSSGIWVEAKNVTSGMEQGLMLNQLQSGLYSYEWADLHSLSWMTTGFPVVSVKYEKNVLTLHFGMHNAPPPLDIAHAADLTGTIFESVSQGVENGAPYYALTVRQDVKLDGYWSDYGYGTFKLYLKLRKSLAEGAMPLQGMVFVVDPGHGGGDPGAKGPMGVTMAEKEITLSISEKLAARLRALGAEVHMTRTGDTQHDTTFRAEFSRSVKPDMFISIHCNSTAETTDATNIRGLTMWYRNALSSPLADVFMRELHMVNPDSTRSLATNYANFFVTRPSWAPSVLIETSFINNIHDYVWLINQDNQQVLASEIAQAAVEYYK